jgi:hypothetical protein
MGPRLARCEIELKGCKGEGLKRLDLDSTFDTLIYVHERAGAFVSALLSVDQDRKRRHKAPQILLASPINQISYVVRQISYVKKTQQPSTHVILSPTFVLFKPKTQKMS